MTDNVLIEELENLFTPFCYSGETLFPKFGKNGDSCREEFSNGFISEDSTWACIYNEYKIQCFSLNTHISDVHYKPKSQIAFSIPAKPFAVPAGALLKSVCEVALHKQRPWVGGLQRLLLGFDCTPEATLVDDSETNLGALAVYDQVQQVILKWIPVPEPVSCMKILAHSDTGDSLKPFFNPAMMAMVGIATVGHVGGKVLVVDLGLDRISLSAGVGSQQSLCRISPDVHLNITSVDPFDRQIATHRHNSIRNNNLISFYVGDNVAQGSNDPVEFIYNIVEGPDKTYSVKYDKEDIVVTAIEYVANIGCLLVGYNFGAFQLWRMDDLTLIHGSLPPEVESPVHSFGFQQPIDDPKNFCYIWVLFGSRACEAVKPKLELYQLFFMDKSNLESFGCIYQNLQKFLKNLSITLEDTFLPPASNESVEFRDCEVKSKEYPIRLYVKNELTFVSWKVERTGLFYVGLFDLNTWYSARTPSSLPAACGIVEYWVAIPVERLNNGIDMPWDFRVLSNSVQRWDSHFQPADFHTYPASISFQGVCLTDRGSFSFDHFGVQEKIIRLISKEGASLMAEPVQLQQYCHLYGLQPRTTKIYEPDLYSEKDKSRFLIFTTLLECKRPAIIVQLANAWLDGSYSDVGCTVNLIIDWIKDLSLSVRALADEHWGKIFTLPRESLLPDTLDFVGYSNFIWNALFSLLCILVRHDEVYSSLGTRGESLESLKYSLKKLVEYSAALSMFFQAEILPSNSNLLETMANAYAGRRSLVFERRKDAEIIPDEYKSKFHVLVIDQLMSDIGEEHLRKEWNLDAQEALYPPKHTGYILNMLLWAGVESLRISKVIFYFILDYMSVANLPSSVLKGDFASVIQLNGDEQQAVYNMWRIDHGYFEDPLAYMTQNSVLVKSDVSTMCWSTGLVILAGFVPEDAIINLLSLGCPLEVPKLYVSLLGRIPHLRERLMSYVVQSAAIHDRLLLRYFFQVAIQNEFLRDFINRYVLRAPMVLQLELKLFLQSNYDFEHQALLLDFYLTIRSFEEARQQLDHMALIWADGKSLNTKQKQAWAQQQDLVKRMCDPSKESVVMNFLKTEIEVAKPVLSPVAIKTKKVPPPVIAPLLPRLINSSNHPSPLRHYTPRTHNAMDDSSASLEVSIEENQVSEEQASMMQSLLRTPLLDHRSICRMADRDNASVCCETPQAANVETHSILKSATKSGRLKPHLRTRFMDDASLSETEMVEEFLPVSQEKDVMPLVRSSDARRSRSKSPAIVSVESNESPAKRQRNRHDSPGKDDTPMALSIAVKLARNEQPGTSEEPRERDLATPDSSFHEEFLTPVSASPAGVESRCEIAEMEEDQDVQGNQVKDIFEPTAEYPGFTSIKVDINVAWEGSLVPLETSQVALERSEQPVSATVESAVSNATANRAEDNTQIEIFNVTATSALDGTFEAVGHAAGLNDMSFEVNIRDKSPPVKEKPTRSRTKSRTASPEKNPSQKSRARRKSESDSSPKQSKPKKSQSKPLMQDKVPKRTSSKSNKSFSIPEPIAEQEEKDKTDMEKRIGSLSDPQTLVSQNPVEDFDTIGLRNPDSTPEIKAAISLPLKTRRKAKSMPGSSPEKSLDDSVLSKSAFIKDKVPKPKTPRKKKSGTEAFISQKSEGESTATPRRARKKVTKESPTKLVSEEKSASSVGSVLIPEEPSPSKSVKETEKLLVSEKTTSATEIREGYKVTTKQTIHTEMTSRTMITSEEILKSDAALKAAGILTDDSDEDTELKADKSAASGTSDISMFDASTSIFDTTATDWLGTGPRRLTRRQKSILESKGDVKVPLIGEVQLTPPKHSPVGSKSPTRRSTGRKRKEKAEDNESVASDSSINASPVKRRTRSSATPDSDVSQLSGRRKTRSASVKKDDITDLDASFASQESSASMESQRSTRSRSRGKTPVPVVLEPESPEVTQQESAIKKTKRRTPSSRASSEPPGGEPKRRSSGRKNTRAVMGFAPDVSTVTEDTQEMSSLSASQDREKKATKRKRSGLAGSIVEEEEPEENADASLSESVAMPSTKRNRRAVTPSSTVSETGVTTRRRRHSSASAK